MGVKLGFSYCRRNRLRVLENRLLRRIFGPKKEEVTGELRKIHNEELNDLYCSRPTCLLKQQCHWRTLHLPVVSENHAEFLPRRFVQTQLWMSPPTPTAMPSVNNKRCERSQVVTAVLLRIQILWCVTPCRWDSV